MRVALATLCLNEMEWLPKLYEQHKDWPGLVSWTFVEGADVMYTGPTTPPGLSIDGTTAQLMLLAARDPRVSYLPIGRFGSRRSAQGKCEARNAYLQHLDVIEPDVLIVVDADEFWPKAEQIRVLDIVRRFCHFDAFYFKHREIWKTLEYEVVGGFWSIPYCRVWRWKRGMRYIGNHNTPSAGGLELTTKPFRGDKLKAVPEFVHMGFASKLATRQAKHAYYRNRGEGRLDHRGWYVESRAAWETWKPGDTLPRGAQVIPYTGPIPEALR